MSTRSSNNSLTVLTETPGPNDVKICGSRLPCYKQVLFCFLSNLEKLKAEDSTNNRKLYEPCAKLVVEEIVIHYNKTRIPTIHEKKMTEKVLNVNDEYRNLFKIVSAKRLESPKIKEFCAKLEHTMPFWPKDMEKKMEENKVKSTTQIEKQAINKDILFLRSMKTDRTAQYSSKDKIMENVQMKRASRQQKAEKLSSQEADRRAEDNVVILSESSDSAQESEGEKAAEPPLKRSHKTCCQKRDNNFYST